VTAKQSDSSWVAERVQPYLDAIASAGGEPRLLAPDVPADSHLELRSIAHGLLLSGGGDIHPRRYGLPVDGTEVDSIDEERDDLELKLTCSALGEDVPLLAICRGIQVLNVAMGGKLVQHIEGHRNPPPNRSLQHDVRVVPGSRLAQVLGCGDTLRVNSSHHQAISEERLAAGLWATARSLLGDDLIEAVEGLADGWIVGVQWHPERVAEVSALHRRLFSAFVDAARRKQEQDRAL
jgi:putative glutamine amidotransferase